MSQITLRVIRREPVAGSVLVVGGAVDLACGPRLDSAVGELLDTAPARLVLDLRAVEFVDSTGLAVLVRARRRALREGVELRLVCDVPRTLKLLDLTGLSRSFEIYPNSKTALEAHTAST